MSDEVSLSIRLGILVVCIAAVVATVANTLIFSLKVFNNYTGKFADNFAESPGAVIFDLEKSGEVAMPIIYTSVYNGIGVVNQVVLNTWNGSSYDTEKIYAISPVTEKLDCLYTELTNSFGYVKVTEDAQSSLLNVEITEVVK